MRTALFYLIFFYVSIPAYSQLPDLKKIDSIFSTWDKKTTPGGAVGVIKGNQLIFSKGYGMADLEHNIPITPSSVFYIASTGKQFTTFCILLLEEQGKLSLEDDIRKFLPDFPKYDAPIKISHLVHHTSGIKDFATLFELEGKNYLDHMPKDDTYQLIKAQSSLNFTPGEQYSYSNSCYFLLGLIVEKASGKSLKEFAHENIFVPLGMRNTMYLDDNRSIIPNRAFSYEKVPRKDSFYNVIRRFDLVGSGGVYSSVEDLFLWDQNFYHNKLGKGGQDIIKRMHETDVFNNGSRGEYAFGLEIGQYRGLRRVSHLGGHAGYRAQLVRFPDQQFSVIVLANRSDADGDKESYAVADLFLPDLYKSPNRQVKKQTAPKTIKLTGKEIEKFQGYYLNEQRGFSRRIISKNDTLYYYRRENSQEKMVPVNKNEFVLMDAEWPENVIRFNEDQNGVRSLAYLSAGVVKDNMIRYQPKVYATEELRRFEGAYYCKDINSLYELRMEENNLVLFINDKRVSPLSTITDNALSDGFNLFLFPGDDAGKPNRFALSNTRVKDLQFIRK